MCAKSRWTETNLCVARKVILVPCCAKGKREGKGVAGKEGD